MSRGNGPKKWKEMSQGERETYCSLRSPKFLADNPNHPCHNILADMGKTIETKSKAPGNGLLDDIIETPYVKPTSTPAISAPVVSAKQSQSLNQASDAIANDFFDFEDKSFKKEEKIAGLASTTNKKKIDKGIASTNILERTAVARNENLTDEQFLKLANDPEIEVLKELVEHPYCPVNVLDVLRQRGFVDIARKARAHSNYRTIDKLSEILADARKELENIRPRYEKALTEKNSQLANEYKKDSENVIRQMQDIINRARYNKHIPQHQKKLFELIEQTNVEDLRLK